MWVREMRLKRRQKLKAEKELNPLLLASKMEEGGHNTMNAVGHGNLGTALS